MAKKSLLNGLTTTTRTESSDTHKILSEKAKIVNDVQKEKVTGEKPDNTEQISKNDLESAKNKKQTNLSKNANKIIDLSKNISSSEKTIQYAIGDTYDKKIGKIKNALKVITKTKSLSKKSLIESILNDYFINNEEYIIELILKAKEIEGDQDIF